MTNEEKYYRRTYSLLEDLIYTYKDGYNKKKTKLFWENNYNAYNNGSKSFMEKKEGLLLTIIIALMGINKESIEKREVITGYNNNCVDFDFRTIPMDLLTARKIQEFENTRTKETIFDNWLSIVKSPEIDTTNEDIIRRIRNGLLHSNFTMDTESDMVSFTNIKTKSYYESKILNQNFQQFIMAYYSNLPTVGVCDKTILFYRQDDLTATNDDELREWLYKTWMLELEHSVDSFTGFNTLDNKITEIINKDKISQQINEKIMNIGNGITIKDIQYKIFNDDGVDSFIKIIKQKYGKDFYKLSDKEKEKIIHNIFEYMYKNKKQISNWLLHFSHLVGNSINQNYSVDDDFYYDDEYATLSLQPTLAILKAYLILYRLQNNNFDKIDYNLVSFKFDDEYWLWSELNGEKVTDNYFDESFYKLKEKNNELTNNEIRKQILCEVIRDSLAHGNIRTLILEDGRDYIEIKDIDKKTNKARCICMALNKFQEFINSEAFLPKYCIKKEDKSKSNKIFKLSKKLKR